MGVAEKISYVGSPLRGARHFWVASAPYFTAKLLLLPTISSVNHGPEGTESLALRIFDSDGEQINELTIRQETNSIESIDITRLMGACKYEGGFCHGHLAVKESRGLNYSVCLEADRRYLPLDEPAIVTRTTPAYVPFSCSPHCEPLIALVNCGESSVRVATRLYHGDEVFQAVRTVPGNGSRVVSPIADFPNLRENRDMVGYVEVAVPQAGELVRVQLMEQIRLPDQTTVYSVLT